MGISEVFTIALGLLAGYFFFASLFEKQNADNENTSLSPIFILLLTICVASGYILFTDSTSKLAGIVFFLALSILAVSFHEFGHAYTALLGGDKSVIRNGYLSLDPLKYSHPLLSVVMPVLFMLIGGLPLPGGAVYIDESAIRTSLWKIIVSAAGVAANAIMLLVIVLASSRFPDSGTQVFWSVISFFVYIQIAVVLFNLLPIPPLDGFSIVTPMLPRALEETLNQHRATIGFLPLFLFLIPNPIAREIFELARAWTQDLGFEQSLISRGSDFVFGFFRNLR